MPAFVGNRRALRGVDLPAYYRQRWGAVSVWRLDESGTSTRFDSVGTNNLTNNNAVSAAAGKLGGASQFTAASTQYLSIADNASLSTGDVDFWVACWVYLDSKAASMGVLLKGNNAAQDEWGVDYSLPSDYFRFYIQDSGGVYRVANATTFGAAATATWLFVFGYHDSVNNTVNISVNNGAFNSGAAPNGPTDRAGPFEMGRQGAGSYLDGRLDQVVWGKSPPAGIAAVKSEIPRVLYNGGAGWAF